MPENKPSVDQMRRELKRHYVKKHSEAPSSQVKPIEGPSGLESLAAGLSQGVTFGLSDEILGAARAGYKKLTEGGDISQLYKEERDALREFFKSAEEKNPKLFMGGELGSALVPGAGLAKGAKAVGKIGTAGMAGLSGLASGYGYTEKEDIPGQVKDTLTGGVLGFGAGALLPAAGKAISKKGKEIGKKLGDISEERAFKAATGQSKKAFKEAAQMGALKTRGADLLTKDEAGDPVIGWLSRVEDIVPKAKAKKDYYGKLLGEVGGAIDERVPEAVDGEKIADRILDYASKNVKDTPKNRNVIKALLEEADFYSNQKKMSFSDAQGLKGSYVFKPTDQTTQVLGQDATNAVRKAVKDEMDETVTNMSKDSATPQNVRILLDKYKGYKQKYGSFKGAQNTAEERAFSNLSNRFVSPSDYGVGAAAATTGALTGGGLPALALGAGGAIANKLARERGSAFAARSADLLKRAGGKVKGGIDERISPYLLPGISGPIGVMSGQEGPVRYDELGVKRSN